MKSVLVQCDFLSMDRWANNQGGGGGLLPEGNFY